MSKDKRGWFEVIDICTHPVNRWQRQTAAEGAIKRISNSNPIGGYLNGRGGLGWLSSKYGFRVVYPELFLEASTLSGTVAPLVEVGRAEESSTELASTGLAPCQSSMEKVKDRKSVV